jgi:hypothetical protein
MKDQSRVRRFHMASLFVVEHGGPGSSQNGVRRSYRKGGTRGVTYRSQEASARSHF